MKAHQPVGSSACNDTVPALGCKFFLPSFPKTGSGTGDQNGFYIYICNGFTNVSEQNHFDHRATSGFGKAMAEKICSEGWTVSLQAEESDRLDALSSELQSQFNIQHLHWCLMYRTEICHVAL